MTGTWCRKPRLPLNLAKTSIVAFTRKRKFDLLKDSDLPPILANGTGAGVITPWKTYFEQKSKYTSIFETKIYAIDRPKPNTPSKEL